MRRFLRKLLSFGIFMVIILGIAYVVVSIMMIKEEVVGNSMEPVLSDGDQVMCNKLMYSFNPPERNDIAVIELSNGERIVKRVIGLPGEIVRVNGFGKIEVNGHELTDDKGVGIIMKAGNAKKDVRLGMEEFFVLGDNRNDSIDSRNDEVGIIKRGQFVGKVIFRVYPFDRIGAVD